MGIQFLFPDLRMTFQGTLSVFIGLSLGIGLASCGDAPTEAPTTSIGQTSKPFASPSDADRSVVKWSDKAKQGASLMSFEGSLVTNGGFEENATAGDQTLTGWSTYNEGWTGWHVQAGVSSPASNFAVPAPPAGSFAAMADQIGPGVHMLYQDVTIPAGGADLEFDLFIANRASAWYSPNVLSLSVRPNQQFRVDVVNPLLPVNDNGDGVLANIYQTGGDDAFVSDGYFHVTASLDQFAGQTVRLRFAAAVTEWFFQTGLDNVAVYPNVIEVDVDVKPGSSTNPVNIDANGSLPVAILTTSTFDAATIDAASVRLGDNAGTETAINANKNGVLQYSLEDVDGDGDLDFVAHFSIQALVGNGDLTATSTSLTITGTSDDGDIMGSDSVTIL